jgi:hypothetical protein
MFSGLKKVTMGVVRGAPVSPDFEKQLAVPIFFSHGLSSAPY